jgi:hypothetical protein
MGELLARTNADAKAEAAFRATVDIAQRRN